MHISTIISSTPIRQSLMNTASRTLFSETLSSIKNIQAQNHQQYASNANGKMLFKTLSTLMTQHTRDIKREFQLSVPNNKMTPTLLANRIDNTIPTDPNRAPGFFTKADILDPRTLHNKIRDKDYVLLTHGSNPYFLAAIYKEGLRSAEDMALDPNTPDNLKKFYTHLLNPTRFSNDPSLIYFRPATKLYGCSIERNDIVIAVDPKAIFVFDQEHRIRPNGTAQSYQNSAIPLGKYHDLYANKPPHTFLSKDKIFIPTDYYENGMDYRPECCLKANKIDPALFVDMSDKNILQN